MSLSGGLAELTTTRQFDHLVAGRADPAGYGDRSGTTRPLLTDRPARGIGCRVVTSSRSGDSVGRRPTFFRSSNPGGLP